MSQNVVRVVVPKSLSLKEVLEFCASLEALPPADIYDFDFRDLGWSTPFGMLFLSEYIRKFREARPSIRFRALNHEGRGYEAYMGFFRAFGLKYGNEPGEAPGNSRYLPIRTLDFADVEHDAAIKGDAKQDAVERHADEISRVLARQTEGPLVDALAYSFREILRNSLEHSGAEDVRYCAQYWPTQSKVEIAILDSGLGMRATLSRNPHLEVESDRDALNQGLLPGVSGSFYEGVRERHDDFWQNSGFGLYMTSRLCGTGGSFVILSGDCAVVLKGGKRRHHAASFQGTAIRATLATSQLGPLDDALARFRREGEAQAAELGRTARVSSSMASKMLARDFKSKRS